MSTGLTSKQQDLEKEEDYTIFNDVAQVTAFCEILSVNWEWDEQSQLTTQIATPDSVSQHNFSEEQWMRLEKQIQSPVKTQLLNTNIIL